MSGYVDYTAQWDQLTDDEMMGTNFPPGGDRPVASREEGIAYLLRKFKGCPIGPSHYGTTTAECAAVAWDAAKTLAAARSVEVTRNGLISMMDMAIAGSPTLDELVARAGESDT